jgi:uncharacterized membrane protein YkvA (DUF1232 family)
MSEKYMENLGLDASIYVQQRNEGLKEINSIKEKAKGISEKDVEYVERNFWRKLSQLKGKFNFKRDLLALYKFMKDPKVSFIKKSLAVFALAYFILPLDSIPDISPIVGFLDDIGIVAMVVRYLSKELERYYD